MYYTKLDRLYTYLNYIIYLRKSRQDDPNETVEEVLAKHEAQLQEYAERELGGRIPEENIYREVVSGESIEDRVAIKEVLARIEDPDIVGVLVVEPARLSRGDLEDCGRLISDFRYTKTLVVTPVMAYDLENKYERRFFQDELLRGRDYLEYTKEILLRGRIAAVKRGCFITTVAPFGYNKVKIGKDFTLEPNKDADTVRYIFDLRVNKGLTFSQIARRLNDEGYKTARENDWNESGVRNLTQNIHYIGKVRFYYHKNKTVLEYGKRVNKLVKTPDEEVLIAEGKHPAIIDAETFNKAQAMISNAPRSKINSKLLNPLAGLTKCTICGYALTYAYRPLGNFDVFICKRGGKCQKSVPVPQVIDGLIYALEHVELPKLRARLATGEGTSGALQKKRIEALAKQLEEFKEQEDNQYELLETKKYTQAVFDKRNAALRAKMQDCEAQLQKAKASLPKRIDYADKVVKLEEAIAGLKDKNMPAVEKNRLLKAIVEKVTVATTHVRHGETEVKLDVFLRL